MRAESEGSLWLVDHNHIFKSPQVNGQSKEQSSAWAMLLALPDPRPDTVTPARSSSALSPAMGFTYVATQPLLHNEH